jgi:hypothetical protein
MSARIVAANEIRSTGPKFDQWPAEFPEIAYVMADGGFLCVTCANGGNGSYASLDADRDDQWRIIGAQRAEIDFSDQCGHCGRRIPVSVLVSINDDKN